MKKTIGILLALILALTMLPSAAFAEGEITDFDGLKAAAGTAGEYTLGADIAVSETLEISADVTINGGGKTLTYGEGFTGSVFKVNNGGKLTLKNVVIDGGYADWGVNTDNNTITFVAGSGTPKSAAPVTNANGIVVLSGITIKNLVRDKTNTNCNSALLETRGSATLADIRMENCYGCGGLLVSVDASTEKNPKVTINNVTVTNNVAIDNGSLIRCTYGSTEINKLDCQNNKFTSCRGVIFDWNGSISLNDSTISNNEIYEGGLNRGGIFHTYSYPSIKSTISGTVITNNTVYGAAQSGSIYACGGSIEITGSTISENGGILYVRNSTPLTVEAGVTIGETVKVEDTASIINKGTVDGNVILSDKIDGSAQCKGAYVTNTGTITGNLTINTKSEDSTSSGNVKGHITVTNGKLTITGGYYGDSIEAITPYLADGLRAVPSDNPEYTCMVVPAGAVRVSFDVNGGDALVPSFTYTDGQGVLSQLPAATRANYRFNGWYTAPMGGTRIVEGSIFTTDTIVFAQWTYIESGSSGDDYPIFTTPAPAPAPVGLPTTGDMTIFEMILSWLGLL